MALRHALLAEFKSEADSTRKMLERVPFEKGDFQPHPKSMTLERLATHVAEIPNWAVVTMTTPELDFAKGYTPNKPANKEELMKLYEDCSSKAIEVLSNMTEEQLDEMWSLRNGEQIYFTMPKKVVLRGFVFNHLVHHRAQLGMYLRLLDVPVPGMYGPTADEPM